MRHRFRTTQWLPYPVDFVFAFFANPSNLPKLQPTWQRARIEEIELHPAQEHLDPNPHATIAAGRGTRVTLSFRPTPLAPVRVAWVALIEDFHWNERFCDRQIEGPFRYWRQCHRVQPHESERTGEPGTLVIDTVEYEVPFGLLGRFTSRVALTRVLESVFRHRQHRTEQLLRELSAGAESLA
jgi:ligand-binding SRPBCC domain-containing protein